MRRWLKVGDEVAVVMTVTKIEVVVEVMVVMIDVVVVVTVVKAED